MTTLDAYVGESSGEGSAIGVDVGGTHVRGCAVWRDATGEWQVGPATKIAWHDGRGTPPVDALTDAIRQVEAGVSDDLPMGSRPVIGVGLAAQMSADGAVVVNAPNIGWRNVRVRAEVSAGLGRSASEVALINDVNAILLGEIGLGAARGAADAVACFVGTGVGGAIVAGGRLITGAGGNAGEIGHMKVAGVVAECGCGEIGCIEALAGGRALDRRIGADAESGRWATDARGSWVSAVDAAARADDPYATALWDEVSEGLSGVLSGLCTALNPTVLLLGGGVLMHAPTLVDLTVARTRAQTLAVCRGDLDMRMAELGDRAGALGAAWFALEESASGG